MRTFPLGEFKYHKDTDTLTAFHSDLYTHRSWLSEITRGSSFQVQGRCDTRTFALSNTFLDADNDITHWEFTCTNVKAGPGRRLIIWND